MKYSIFISVLFWGFASARAEFLPNEVNLCSLGGCTPNMQSIQDEFTANQEFIPFMQAEAAFYSGVCYHVMRAIDPEHAHHGGFAFWVRPEEGATAFNGAFSFFASRNPYQGMSVEQGIAHIQTRSSNPKVVREEPTQGRVVIESESAVINYWMRTNGDGSEMTLLSLWDYIGGPKYRSFCRLSRH